MTTLRDISVRTAPWAAAGIIGAGVYVALKASQLRRMPQAPSPEGPRIVILGGGFAGLTAARSLRRRLGDRGKILLIDRHNYHLFTPLLYQVAACGVDPYDVAYPLRQFAGRQGVAFRSSTVTGIDLDTRRIHLEGGEEQYDYLIIALGSTTNYFDNQSAREHALSMKSLEEGVALRNRVLEMLEQAAASSDPAERQLQLTFVIVGGGATGVEMAAALADLLHQAVAIDYPNLKPTRPQVVVVESEAKLLGHMSDAMAAVALDRLRAKGVQVWLNTKAKEVGPDYLETEGGQRLGARTIIWAAGIRAPDVVAGIKAPHGRGGSLLVDRYLQVEGYSGVFAVGDNAHAGRPDGKHSVPLVAQAAVQEGEAVAENVARAIEGRPQKPFHYRELGNVVSIGQGQGVAEIGGIVMDGLFGNLFYRLVHLARITGFRNRLATAVEWGVGSIYGEDTTLLDLVPAREAQAVGTGGRE